MDAFENQPGEHRPATTPLFASSWVALFLALRAHLVTGEAQHLRPEPRRRGPQREAATRRH
jgi:hypothetical protein